MTDDLFCNAFFLAQYKFIIAFCSFLSIKIAVAYVKRYKWFKKCRSVKHSNAGIVAEMKHPASQISEKGVYYS